MEYSLVALSKLLFRSLKRSLFGVFFCLLIIQSVYSQSADAGKPHFQVCAACHTIGGGKLIGPDLKDIGDQRDEAWLIKFIQNSQEVIQSGDEVAVQLFAEYNNIPMPPNNLTDDQVRDLLAYIEAESKGGIELAETPAETTEEAPEDHTTYADEILEYKIEHGRNYGYPFWISFALFFIVFIDLFLTKLIKAKFVHIIVMIIAAIIMVEVIVTEAIALGRQEGYSPDQPIAFSHKIHVKQNKIDCKYCHHTADNSRHAGIPSLQLCMNCHNVVKEGKTTGTEEIAKIYDAIENQKPIEWIKVHNLPDHVFFSHAQHVNVGEIDCTVCHGDVEEMDRITQVYDLGMGWCINCHRETRVMQFETNEFYTDYIELHEKLKSGELQRVTVKDIGGNDCQRCHY